MDLSRVLQDDAPHENTPGKRARLSAPQPSHPSPQSEYADLLQVVRAALGGADRLTAGDKLTLALEVLHARRLEADLVMARSKIRRIAARAGSVTDHAQSPALRTRRSMSTPVGGADVRREGDAGGETAPIEARSL